MKIRARLQNAIDSSADPLLAHATITRIVEAHPSVADLLVDNELFRSALVAITCASRSLSAALISDTTLHTVLIDPVGILQEMEVAAYAASWASASTSALEQDEHLAAALRRWKRQCLLRIASRDLLGIADLPTVGRELAALAQACLAASLVVAQPEGPIAVIGMGKLGGGELNYSSDVDVLFIHEGDQPVGERTARELLAIMATPTPDGIVFRTDANLRPEGRAGPLSRSIESYAAYYERWAQTWEIQALIKARPIAGDTALAQRFTTMIEPFVWPEKLDPDAIREVRTMKARSEQELRKRGLDERELKRGRGGIRDIEFAVQLLQLVHGRHDPGIRSPNTLLALDQLIHGGYVGQREATSLQESYVFLRTVEHRLQLEDEAQVHTLPVDLTARTRLARVLGYRDQGVKSALELFETEHRRHQSFVRDAHEKLFFRPLLEAFAGTGPVAPGVANERLAALGFLDIPHAQAAVTELTGGLTRRSRLMQQLVPLLLEWTSTSPDPDLGLLQLRTLTEGRTRSSALTTVFRESTVAAERVCRLLGSSRVIGQALRRQPDFIALLGDDAFLERRKTRDELVDEALETLSWRPGADERREGLRRFKRRELLRIAARDVLGFATTFEVGNELTALAEACLEAALVSVEPPVPFAVIGMGRLGGRDLSYASDIDVLFVYEGDGASDFTAAEGTALAVIGEVGAITPEGQTFQVDTNLRPEGRQGALARSLDGYCAYYERWAQVWEFQALTKARPVAGNAEIGERFMRLIEPLVYRQPAPAEWVRDIRKMKARIESERIPPGQDAQFHLKLGRGTLSDVEFTVQLLQLLHGEEQPELRTTSTHHALERLEHAALVSEADAQALRQSYDLCERARNARYLMTGTPSDSLPGGVDGLRLARMLGYVHNPHTSMRDDYRRLTRRSRSVVERIFYGRDEALRN